MSNSVEQINKIHERLASTCIELNEYYRLYYDDCVYSELKKGVNGNWFTVVFGSCDCGNSESCDRCGKKKEFSYEDLCEIAKKLMNSGYEIDEIDTQLLVSSIETCDLSEDNVITYGSMLYALLRGALNCLYATALLEEREVIKAVKAINKASALCEECDELAAAGSYGLERRAKRVSETGRKNVAKRNEKYGSIRRQMYGVFMDRCPPEGWTSTPKAVEAILPEMELIYKREFGQSPKRDITRTLSSWIAKSDKCREKIRSLNKKGP